MSISSASSTHRYVPVRVIRRHRNVKRLMFKACRRVLSLGIFYSSLRNVAANAVDVIDMDGHAE